MSAAPWPSKHSQHSQKVGQNVSVRPPLVNPDLADPTDAETQYTAQVRRRRKPRLLQGLRWLGIAVALLTPLGVAAGGASIWHLTSYSPAYRPLIEHQWREAAQLGPETVPAEHPRRHMAYTAQDWLEAEHPTRAEVHQRLGLPDLIGTAGTEVYRVGCGFTGPGCEGEDWLVIGYNAEKRVDVTSFQRAGAAADIASQPTPAAKPE